MIAIQRKTGLVLLGLALLLAGALWLGSNQRSADSPAAPSPRHSPEQPIPARETGKQPSSAQQPGKQPVWGKRCKEPVRKLSGQELADIEEAQVACSDLMDALDGNDMSAILAKARALINHPNPEVRQRVLDALDWVGSDALYDLADMLGDENSEISDAATESFWEQVADLPNDQAKLKLLEGFSNSQDPEMLSHLAEELSEYHPYVAYDLIQSVLSASPGTLNEDIQWELEGMAGESFETAAEWKKWFAENKSNLESDYKELGF